MRDRVQPGMRLRASVDIDTTGMIHYSAPFTGGFHCTIPRGTVLQVLDRQAGPLFFSCTIPDKAVEAALVPAEDRQDSRYAGHSFVFGAGEIGKRLEIVSHRADRT